MQRFIKTREVPQKIKDKDGKEKTIMVPEGYLIGPGKRSYLNPKGSHFGKPEEYYKRRNTPKKERRKTT